MDKDGCRAHSATGGQVQGLWDHRQFTDCELQVLQSISKNSYKQSLAVLAQCVGNRIYVFHFHFSKISISSRFRDYIFGAKDRTDKVDREGVLCSRRFS